MNTDELIDAVREWGEEKGINNPDKQTIKLMEECGELAHEISRGHYYTEDIKDAIGDITVVLIILADILNLDFKTCLDIAYHTIKDRSGTTVDGGFIKKDPAEPHDERVSYQSY